MTYPRTPRRKPSLRQAFVSTITVAVAAASALSGVACIGVTTNPPPPPTCPAEPAAGDACGVDEPSVCSYSTSCNTKRTYTCSEGAWTITDEPNCVETCPVDAPQYGEACTVPNQSCTYLDDLCGFQYEARCINDVWDVDQITCNPPPASCPNELPEIGTACVEEPDTIDGYPGWCGFPVVTPCGDETMGVGCEFDDVDQRMEWAVVEAPTCTATPEQCQGYDSSTTCGADAGCTWQVPGCDVSMTTPAVPEGCYPAEECNRDTCDGWGSCVTVVTDPCWNSDCDVCSDEIDVCMPNE